MCLDRMPAVGFAGVCNQRADQARSLSTVVAVRPAVGHCARNGTASAPQLEDILPALALEPGSRVLDLGCGHGATSVFLARECGVTVTACDLWVSVEELEGVFREAGVERSVTAVNADVRQLPFADDEFDAIVSIDAFEYFGTDVHLLPALLRVLKSGGTIGMTTPGLEPDPYEADVPNAV